MKRAGRSKELRIIPLPFPDEIHAGDALIDKLLFALKQSRATLRDGDILIVKHKIVSKAEGQFVELDTVRPSARSKTWARRYKLDARVVELALAQSKRIVRRKNGVLITETRHGFVCANSGIDVSNVDGGTHALLLPEDPDRSAARLHRQIRNRLQRYVPVIITDTFGRPWREGLTEAAIGVAGMKAVHDYRGARDSHSYPLRVSVEAVADELACAAGLVCGKLTRTPACIVRGFPYQRGRGSGAELLRPQATDLFR
jgi:coenzyme F420-0:L-glutamate ligase / coenzyme F420-1:gamma-L-glutamate ligase